jgi:hypothetical protein
LDPLDRILRYKGDQLAGIIFGMNTPVEEQLRIFEVVERKPRESINEEFAFYKATYSPMQARFEVHKLNLLEFLNRKSR